VANFIGDSNIVSGTMLRDYLVRFHGVEFPCVDAGFGEDTPVDVVIRPEDIKLCSPENGQLKGTVESIVFKGVHYEMIVRSDAYAWKIQSTKFEQLGANVGMQITPEDIHIMRKAAANE